MKSVLTLFVALALCAQSVGQKVIVDGEEFFLTSSGENKAEVIREFLPKGQKLADWTRLVSIRHIPGQKSPKDYIASLAQTYHSAYPHMQFSADRAGDDWFLDFIAYPREETIPTFAEWNFFVARKHPKKRVVVYQYAVRAYSSVSLDEAFRKLDARSLRPRMLEKLKKEAFKEEPNQTAQTTPGLRPSVSDQ